MDEKRGKSLKSRSRALQERFKITFVGSKRLQERSKRLSRGFQQGYVLMKCLKIAFFIDLDLHKESLGRPKSFKKNRTVRKNQGFAILSSHRLFSSI